MDTIRATPGALSNLRSIRHARGMSQRAVAEKAGLAVLTVLRAERTRAPNMETVVKIAKALDVAPGDLM